MDDERREMTDAPSPQRDSGAFLGSPLARRLVDLVRENPGVSLRDAARQLDASWGTVAYHCRRLEREGYLRLRADGRRRLLYPGEESLVATLHACAAMLQGRTMRLVADAIRANPGASRQDLARLLDLPPASLRYHVERLVAAGLAAGHAPASYDGLVPTPMLDLLLGDPDELARDAREPA